MSFDWKEIFKSLKDEVIPKRWDMQEFVQNFFEGLFLVVPVAVTIYVVFLVFSFIDGWLNIPVPGIGFILTIGMLVLVGRLASNVFFRGALGSLEKVLTRTPFVKLVYTSLKDLIEAFMGEKKRFDQPVLVTLVPGGHTAGDRVRHAPEPGPAGAGRPGRRLLSAILQLCRQPVGRTSKSNPPAPRRQRGHHDLYRLGRGLGWRRRWGDHQTISRRYPSVTIPGRIAKASRFILITGGVASSFRVKVAKPD